MTNSIFSPPSSPRRSITLAKMAAILAVVCVLSFGLCTISFGISQGNSTYGDAFVTVGALSATIVSICLISLLVIGVIALIRSIRNN